MFYENHFETMGIALKTDTYYINEKKNGSNWYPPLKHPLADFNTPWKAGQYPYHASCPHPATLTSAFSFGDPQPHFFGKSQSWLRNHYFTPDPHERLDYFLLVSPWRTPFEAMLGWKKKPGHLRYGVVCHRATKATNCETHCHYYEDSFLAMRQYWGRSIEQNIERYWKCLCVFSVLFRTRHCMFRINQITNERSLRIAPNTPGTRRIHWLIWEYMEVRLFRQFIPLVPIIYL